MADHWSAAVATGAVVELTHVRSGLRVRALVEKKEDAAPPVLTLCSLARPYEKLRVALNAQVAWSAAAAKFASFQVEDARSDRDDGDGAIDSSDAVHASARDSMRRSSAAGAAVALVHFKALAHQKKRNRGGELGWYLGVADAVADADAAARSSSASSSEPELIGDAARGPASVFALAVVSKRGAFALDAGNTVLHGAFRRDPASMLTDSQRRAFMRDGFLQIRDAVPLRLVNAALRRINHQLGVPGQMIDGGVEGAAKLAGNVSNSDALLDLFLLSDARAYAEALIGVDNVAPPRGAQIALRFPELGAPREPRGNEWHTDGMRQGRRHPFSLLVGIALSDVREPLAGNLTVFPGSHRTLHALVGDDGKLMGCDDECYRAESVWGDGTLPDLGEPVQLLAARGDLVLAHPTLAHRGGLNFAPDIRYQVYFRLKHVNHEQLQARAAVELYADLQGLHHLR